MKFKANSYNFYHYFSFINTFDATHNKSCIQYPDTVLWFPSLTTRGLLGVNSVQNFSTSPRQPHHAVPKRSRRQGITAAKSVGGRTRGWKSWDRGGRGHAGEATLYDKSQQQNESKSSAPFYSGMHGSFRISSLMQYTHRQRIQLWIVMHMN